MNFPERIKAKRLALKESQSTFGKRFGVRKNTISRWENGSREAPYKVLDFILSTAA